MSKCENEHFFALWAPKVVNEHFLALLAPKVKKCTFAHFGSIWAHLPPPPPRGAARAVDGWLGEDGEGGGQGLAGQPAVPDRERRPPLSGSGASAPEVVPLHSYPRRGLTGKVLRLCKIAFFFTDKPNAFLIRSGHFCGNGTPKSS